MLENIRIVLVATSHPGNIGAAARAMKTMGLTRLYLVAPKLFPHNEATVMASGADDVLKNAVVCPDLESAIADCTLVIGTSARSRTIPWPMLSPRDLGSCALATSAHAQVAVVFGREQWGLTNEELAQCQYHVQIPSDETFQSLNLASAVQVLTYEIRMAFLEGVPSSAISEEEKATQIEIEQFLKHLQTTLQSIDFLKSLNHEHLMLRLRRLYQRAQLEKTEVNILRGILTATQRVVKNGN